MNDMEKLIAELREWKDHKIDPHSPQYWEHLLQWHTQHDKEFDEILSRHTPKPKDEGGLREALADLEHRRWSLWQSYVHNLSPLNEKGERVIPKESVEHWEKLIATEYKYLSEYSKGMDRKEADKTLEVLSHHPTPDRQDPLAELADRKGYDVSFTRLDEYVMVELTHQDCATTEKDWAETEHKSHIEAESAARLWLEKLADKEEGE